MTLESTSFRAGQEIPRKHGKRSANVSPQLSWGGVPPGTGSFALSMVDWITEQRYYVHWLVVDIPADATALTEGASTAARMPRGTREITPYVGPFPPSGRHTYRFTLYALRTATLVLPGAASLERFTEAAEADALATATLAGTFTAS